MAANENTRYHYEVTGAPYLLTGKTDGRGIRVATYAYDSAGRAISTEGAGGADKDTIAYTMDYATTLVRTVTNPLGRAGTYTWSRTDQLTKLVSLNGAATANCVADAAAWTNSTTPGQEYVIASLTDREGRITAYTPSRIYRYFSIRLQVVWGILRCWNRKTQ